MGVPDDRSPHFFLGHRTPTGLPYFGCGGMVAIVVPRTRTFIEELRQARDNIAQSFQQKHVPLSEVRRLIRFTAEITNNQLGLILKVNAAAFLTLAIVHFCMMFVAFRITYIRLYQDLILVSLSMPFTVYVFCALLRFYITIYRRNPQRLRLHFPGLRAYMNIIVYCLLYYVLYVLLLKVIADFRDYNEVIQARMLLGLIVFLWLHSRLMFVPILILRQDLPIRDAIRESFSMTSKRTTRTLILFFVFSLVLLFGLLSLGVGVLYTFSMAVLGYIAVFNQYLNPQHATPYWEAPLRLGQPDETPAPSP